MNMQRYMVAADNMVRFAELEAVLDALMRVGVEAIVLKGAALAMTAYSSIAERPMKDVDLLIRRSQLALAERCMLDLGYAASEADTGRIGPFRIYATGERSYHRQLGQSKLVFELHWQLSCVEAYSRIAVESLWAERRSLQVGGMTTWQLSPQDNLVNTCVHLATHAYSHAVAYTDIGQVIALPDFSWESCLDRVVQFRVRRVVYYALLLAFQKAQAAVPEDVLAVLCPPLWQDRLVRRSLSSQAACSGRGNQLVLLHIVLSDNLADALRVPLGLIFPRLAWLEDRYGPLGPITRRLMPIVHPVAMFVRVLGSCTRGR